MPAARNIVRHRAAQLVSAREQAQVLDSEEDSKAKPPSRTSLVSHQLVEQDGDGALRSAVHQVKREAYDGARQIRANRNECEHCVCSILSTPWHAAPSCASRWLSTSLRCLQHHSLNLKALRQLFFLSTVHNVHVLMYICPVPPTAHPLCPSPMFPPFLMNTSYTCFPVDHRPVIPSFKLIHSSQRINR